MDGHSRAKRLARQRDERQVPLRRGIVVSHPRAEPELDGLRADLAYQLLEILELRRRAVAAVAAGAVDGDIAPDDGAEQFAERLAGDVAEQVEECNFDARDRDPERQSLPLVIGARDIQLGEQRLEIARVFLRKERRDLPGQDRPRRFEHVGMPRRRADRAIGGPGTHQKLVAGLDQVDRLDEDRRRQQLASQHRRGHQPGELLGARFRGLRGVSPGRPE
jgi:hypothetical protein